MASFLYDNGSLHIFVLGYDCVLFINVLGKRVGKNLLTAQLFRLVITREG